MKAKGEIEEIADKLYGEYAGYHKASFVNGYTQCQLDMADKKYTEEDIGKALFKGFDYCLDNMTEDSSEITQDNVQDFINSLESYE